MKHRNFREIDTLREEFLSGIGVPEQKQITPDAFQLEAVESLAEGSDTLVVAPTGAGKTYIAVEAIRKVVMQGKRAIYTAPLKALSNTKYIEFKKKFEPDYRVGLLTGDRKIEGDADIVIATTEIYRNELFRINENYALVVFDEFHYIADPQRGPVWEESVILSPKSSTLLMLSASVSNAKEIAEWIKSIRQKEVKVVIEKHRPVQLRLGFLHPEHGVMPLVDAKDRVYPEINQIYREDRKFFRQYKSLRGKGKFPRIPY
jgi:superfamily II RNA helicase